MSDGIDRKRIRRHLLIFSLAAPLMAIFTYVLLKSVRRSPTFFSNIFNDHLCLSFLEN